MAAVMIAWEPLPTPTVGVIGPRALRERLGRTLRVERLVPTAAAAVEEVDAVLVARSALGADGSWAGALRPVGFDRGVVLARVLRDARAVDVPVVLVDDMHGAVDSWHGLLDGAVDDALTLGPLGAGGVCWHPGVCWDALALRLAVAQPADPGDSVDLASSTARGDWIGAQRAAVVAGRATMDAGDPWSRHLGAELVQLGVSVRDVADGSTVRRFDEATPAAAAAWLCDHLGLPAPAPRQMVVRSGDGGDERAAVSCRTALERVGGDDGVAVRIGATVAAGPGLLGVPRSQGSDGLLAAVALDLEALA